MRENCKISSKSVIMEDVIIGDNVIIEDNVFIDFGVIIRDNVHIKSGTTIGARCIIGEYLLDFYLNNHINNVHQLVIGQNAIIRSDSIIYGGTIIGDNFQTGHRVTIREKTKIGNNVRIGTLSDIQGDCEIGDYVNLHSNVHIGQKSKIANYVWIFPYVVLTNDPTPPSECMKGVIVDEFAVIATSSTILPGVRIGKDSLIGAGSTVTKDVGERRIFVGSPAKDVGEVTKIKNDKGESVYPWRYTFDRGMPWKGLNYDEWEAKH